MKTKKPSAWDHGKKIVGKKPTVLELEARISEVEGLISLGARRTQIHAAIGAKYQVDWRTTDRYVSRARQNLMERAGKPKRDHQLDSYHFYCAIALSSTAKATDRIRARKHIDELFGLEEPRRQEISGPEGAPIPIVQSATVSIVMPDNGRLNTKK